MSKNALSACVGSKLFVFCFCWLRTACVDLIFYKTIKFTTKTAAKYGQIFLLIYNIHNTKKILIMNLELLGKYAHHKFTRCFTHKWLVYIISLNQYNRILWPELSRGVRRIAWLHFAGRHVCVQQIRHAAGRRMQWRSYRHLGLSDKRHRQNHFGARTSGVQHKLV